MELEQKIEAILFWKGEPVSRKKLGEILAANMAEMNEAIDKLKNNLAGRGIVLSENEDELQLGTAPELSELFEKMQKEELNKELSKASLETLSIVLYKGGASRADIDYIRGVNSSFILRALAIRGLVERAPDPQDSRRNIYKPTFELLSFMGVTSPEELPDYADVHAGIENAVAEATETQEEIQKTEDGENQ